MHANILTTAQKHKMLIEYNQEREQKYVILVFLLLLTIDGKPTKRTRTCKESNRALRFWYIVSRRKTQQGEAGKTQGPSTYEEELNGEYRKIHKVLGATNKNKDIRNQVKEQVDERIENQLTIGMNLTINPVCFFFINL